MTAPAVREDLLHGLLATRWEDAERKLEALSVEIPEEMFDYRPSEEIRTVGDVLRHVAFWHQYVADVLNGRAADDSSNELPAARYPAKSAVLDVLQQNSRNALAAWKESKQDTPAVELMLSFIEHTCEHYGQLAVYSRLLGIVPPSSRGQS